MLDKLEADFDKIIELVNRAPASLQETAFRMILEQWFNANINPIPTSPPAQPAGPGPAGLSALGGVPDAVKPFLTSNAVTTEILEKVFHPAGPGAQLLASSIPGKKSMESRTSWRRGQSIANPSLAEVPCLTGKEQGIFTELEHLEAVSAPNRDRSRHVTGAIP